MSSLEAMQKRLARLHQAQKPNTRLEAEWAALCEGARDELIARLMIAVCEELRQDETLDKESCTEFATVLESSAEQAKQIFMRYHG